MRLVVGCEMHRGLQHGFWDRLLRVNAVIGDIEGRRWVLILRSVTAWELEGSSKIRWVAGILGLGDYKVRWQLAEDFSWVSVG
jgi:hypothetical protein